MSSVQAKHFDEVLAGEYFQFAGVSVNLLYFMRLERLQPLPCDARCVATVTTKSGETLYVTAPCDEMVNVLANGEQPPGWEASSEKDPEI